MARLLRAAHRSMRIEEIEERLNRRVSRLELGGVTAVKEVARDVWQYERQWQHVVDKASMCLLLQSSTRGIAASELRECYPGATFDVDALVAEKFATVVEDKLFYSHPEYLLPVSKELLHRWHLAQLKEPEPPKPKIAVVARKKAHKRGKVDRHNQHVDDLW